MSTIEKVSIALPPDMVAQMKKAIETGEYASSSEVVREALRERAKKRSLRQRGISEYRQVWLEALWNPGPGVRPHEVLDRLERKYQALADASK